ncbi:MAG TPA: C13 family peptidase [Rhizomicrobium sp.]
MTGRMRAKLFNFAAALAIAAFVGGAAQAGGPFADWAAVVVAGDWHAHDGSPSEIFDNSRRDVTKDLLAVGFSKDNVQQFSVRPERYPAVAAGFSDSQSIANALWDLSNRTGAGCLVYFSSHGSRDGLVLGDTTLSPASLKAMLNNTCSDRPMVVIISACFSGVFVAPLEAPNRMVLTAARADRSSFGCGQTDKYPYFDQCVLSSWPASSNFPGLARAVQACVAAREKRERVAPPSQPQLWIGSAAAKTLPGWGPAAPAKAG